MRPGIRRCAAFALRYIHSRESLPFLLSLGDSEDQSIRYEAVAGLASYANTGLIPNERPLLVDGAVVDRRDPKDPQLRPRSADTPVEPEEEFPSIPDFRKDERRNLEFWREWAAKHGIKPADGEP